MAYGIRWFSEFDDIQENVIYRIEIRERDYAGSAVEIPNSGGNPITISSVDQAENPYETLRDQKAVVEWTAEDAVSFEIGDLFITDDRKYKLVVYQYEEDALNPLWYGYIVPIDAEEPYASKPYHVTYSATCGLPFLSDNKFLDAFGGFVVGKQSLIQIIANCLSHTGHELPIHTYLNIFDDAMTLGNPSALQLAEIDADGLRGMTNSQVLEGILAPLGCFIVQSNGAWVIKGVWEQNNATGALRTYSAAGTFTGYSLASQLATIGRTGLPNTPNLRPTSDVSLRLAEPNSLITETVSPGIPVNRLFNGQFAGVVSGGNIPGWNNRITGGTSWSRDGSGRPDDPYRLVFNSFVVFDPKRKINRYKPFSYFDTGPIELNVGPFNVSAQDRHDVKVVVSGALKMNNALGFSMYVTINEQERDYASFLNDDGTWFYSKKEDEDLGVKSSQTEHGPVKTYDDLEIQTFEVTSQEITNLLNIGGNGVARIRVRVFPGVQGPGYIGNPVFLSIEDLSLYVTTDLVYEGEHKYQANANLPIRNANEIDFTSIIADKIGIDTPEQSRAVNRVMTGYMTVAGGNTLTSSWKRYGDVADTSESLQKKALRERLRLLCGKRDVLEGSFLGYGLKPDHTVRNLFEAGVKYFTITGYSWDLKNAIFDATFRELNFDSLGDEDIYLYDESTGARRNRQYTGTGTGGSSGGGSTPKPIELLTIDDPEEQVYEVTVADDEDRVVDVAFLIRSTHTAAELEANIIYYPPWVTEISIYRGEDLPEEDVPDFGILQIVWQARPTASGNYQILVELVGRYGESKILSIPIVVEPSEDFIEEWPPVLLDVPALTFVVDELQTQKLDLKDYYDPEGKHDGTGLTPVLRNKPGWVDEATIVFDELSVTGTADKVGVDYVSFEFSDAIGRTKMFTFALNKIAAPVFTHSLLKTDFPTPEILGTIPGAYKLPERWDTSTLVEGMHDKIFVKVNKGTDPDQNILVVDTKPVNLTIEGEYRAFEIEHGFVTDVGVYRLEFATFLGLIETGREVIFFTLYDEEFLAKMRFELWNAAKIGDIDIDAVAKFKKPDYFNPKAIVTGLTHNKAVLTLSLAGEVIQTRTFNTPAAEYSVYASTPTGQLSGVYTINAKFYDGSNNLVDERQADFEILDKIPEAEEGITLVQMKPNRGDYTVLQQLGLTNPTMDLPDNFNALCSGFGSAVDYVLVEFFRRNGNAFADFDVTRYTKKENYVVYSKPVTSLEILAFDTLSSLEIGDIHQAPSSYRFRFTGKLGGATGKVVGIQQADVSFRTPLAPEDYSGLRMVTFADGNKDVVDLNMPKTGGQYLLPWPDGIWSVQFTKLSTGAEFDHLVIRGKVLTEDGYMELSWSPGAGFIVEYNTAPITDASSLNWGVIGNGPSGSPRTLFDPDGNLYVIDSPGSWVLYFDVYRAGVLLQTIEVFFDLVDQEDIPELPEEDCNCCEEKEWPFTNQTTVVIPHNLGYYPSARIRIGTTYPNSTINHDSVNQLTVTFFRPKTGVVILPK